MSANGDVAPAPAELLVQAQRVMPALTLDQYALARVVASELGNGAVAEQAAIAAADAMRAKQRGRGVHAHVVGNNGRYGRQGYAGRLVATSQDPSLGHVLLAREVLGGTATGAAGGGHVYFDAVVQLNLWKAGRKALHPAVILRKWTDNRSAQNCRLVDGRYTCDLGPAAASGRLEWVGPLAGVRPLRLMIFRSATANAAALNAAAAAELARLEAPLPAVVADVAGLAAILFAAWGIA
ncbi:MAG: hypothetical protein E6Q97_27985 [Desulfurellales bacterium]|nr:MAG: hypothetical protein E6Q97_27985 [Desulfurellales bacterium]